MKTTKHTPTPWKVHPDVPNQIVTDGTEEFFVADLDTGDIDEDNANAAFIVRAVNSYEKLLAILKHAQSSLRTFRDVPLHEQGWTSIDDDVMTLIEEALSDAKAEGDAK